MKLFPKSVQKKANVVKVQGVLTAVDMRLNKRPNWTQYISLTLKSVLNAHPEMWDCTRCPSPEEAGWMLPEQRHLCEYFSPCASAGKVLCLSAGLFTASLKQAALILREPSGTKRYGRKILRGETAPGSGICFCVDNNQVGLFVPRTEAEENGLQDKHTELSSQV